MGSLLSCNRVCLNSDIKQFEFSVRESLTEEKSDFKKILVGKLTTNDDLSLINISGKVRPKKFWIESDSNTENISSNSQIVNKNIDAKIENKQNTINISINNHLNSSKPGDISVTRTEMIHKLNNIEGLDYFSYDNDSNFQIESKISENIFPLKIRVLAEKNKNFSNKLISKKTIEEEFCLKAKDDVVNEERPEIKELSIELNSDDCNENENSIYEKFEITLEESENPKNLKISPKKADLNLSKSKNIMPNKIDTIRKNNYEFMSSCEEGELKKLENNLHKRIKKVNPGSNRKLSFNHYDSHSSELDSTPKLNKIENSNTPFSNMETNYYIHPNPSLFTHSYHQNPIFSKIEYNTPDAFQHIAPFPQANPALNYCSSLSNYSTNYPPIFPNQLHNPPPYNYRDMINRSYNQQNAVLSCAYCEEIYKYIIENNIKLKIMTCLYCNNVTNEVTLEFYIRKYKDELNEIYKSKLNCYSEEFNVLDNIEIKSDIEDTNMTSKIKTGEDIEISIKNKKNKFDLEEFRKKSKKRFKSCDINYSNDKAVIVKDNSPNVLLDSTNFTGASLAEIFKKRKADLISKIESRTKNQNEYSDREVFEIKKMDKMKKKKNKSLNNTKIVSRDKEAKKKKTFEPNKDLLERLIYGKKVKMSKEEMKEVNQRLYNKFANFGTKIREEKKKQELQIIADKKKSFSETLKNQIIGKRKKE